MVILRNECNREVDKSDCESGESGIWPNAARLDYLWL